MWLVSASLCPLREKELLVCRRKLIVALAASLCPLRETGYGNFLNSVKRSTNSVSKKANAAMAKGKNFSE